MRRIVILSFALCFLFAVDDIPGRGQAPVAEPLRTAGDRPIDIQHIRLDLKVDLPKKTVDALATLRFRSLRSIASITLDAVDFEVKKVELGNQPDKLALAKFSQDRGKLIVDVDPVWSAG